MSGVGHGMELGLVRQRLANRVRVEGSREYLVVIGTPELHGHADGC